MPPIQVRDMTVQRRENDLVLATFGRGFYVLDDYSALREITPQALAEEARLFPLRDAYLFNPLGLAPAGIRRAQPAVRATGRRPTRRSARCSPTTSRQALPGDAKLVLTITDDTGRQIRRMDVDKTAGLRRVAWNLRTDPPAGTQAGGRGGGGGGGFGGGRGGAPWARWSPRAPIARRSAARPATTSRRSVRARRSGWWRYRNRVAGSGLGVRGFAGSGSGRGSRGFRL